MAAEVVSAANLQQRTSSWVLTQVSLISDLSDVR